MKGPVANHDAKLAELEERIGHVFKNRALLREALTHGSVHEGQRRSRDYDRLEFLGDRVLGLCVAERLLTEHQSEQEGELAPRFNSLVNRHACAHAARAAGLGDALVLSPAEEASGGRKKAAILGDICGLETARSFIHRFWGTAFDDAKGALRDAKTALQEWAAAKKKHLRYVEIAQSGPEHAPRFSIEAHVEGFEPVRGEGSSKRDAQRAAAEAFLKARGARD
jgi:ribonuclease III